MPHEIRVPRLGWSMEEGKFIGWLKRPGEDVAVGEPLFELEGEKALQQIESVDSGQLHLPPDSPQPGSAVAVGALLGYLLVQGESVAAHSGSTPDVVAAEPPIASPRAKRIASELGVDWTRLKGTGRDGRIREADVRAASVEGAGASDTAGRRASDRPISPRRKAIADRLRLSRDRTVPVTLTTTADATNLVALRDQFKSAQAAIVPSYTDMLACLVATVLKRHPQIAVSGSHAQPASLPTDEAQFHFGIAVDTPDGLLVPIVRDVGHKSLVTVARESKMLIDRARSGRLTADEMQGGDMTITNLGAWGIDAFTPIINYPEIAILGLGAIRRELVVLPDDRTAARHRMTLSLTFDHSAIDGAPAAAFLRDIASAMENAAAHLLSQ